jgi:periplasmic nitrate reductase NapD
MRPAAAAVAATLSGAAAGGDPEEIHIAGVLVQCRPLELMRAWRAVDALDGADVVQSSAEGKLVVVIEAATSRAVMAVVDHIRAIPGVLNVALVYQHAEPAAAMQQPMDWPPSGSQDEEDA